MHEERKHGNSEHLQVWFCQHCDGVHFRTANITLDFSRKEFLELSDAMLGILKSNFTVEDLEGILNFDYGKDDILASDTIV